MIKQFKKYPFRFSVLGIVTLLTVSLFSLINAYTIKEANASPELVNLANDESVIQEVDKLGSVSQEDVQEIENRVRGNTPYNATYIESTQIGKSAFENTFTTPPQSGTTLEVLVKNNNRSGKVIFKVYRGTTDFGYLEVKAGDDLTRTFTMTDGSGVSGDWKVYVTTNDGHSMNISVRSGQY